MYDPMDLTKVDIQDPVDRLILADYLTDCGRTEEACILRESDCDMFDGQVFVKTPLLHLLKGLHGGEIQIEMVPNAPMINNHIGDLHTADSHDIGILLRFKNSPDISGFGNQVFDGYVRVTAIKDKSRIKYRVDPLPMDIHLFNLDGQTRCQFRVSRASYHSSFYPWVFSTNNLTLNNIKEENPILMRKLEEVLQRRIYDVLQIHKPDLPSDFDVANSISISGQLVETIQDELVLNTPNGHGRLVLDEEVRIFHGEHFGIACWAFLEIDGLFFSLNQARRAAKEYISTQLELRAAEAYSSNQPKRKRRRS